MSEKCLRPDCGLEAEPVRIWGGYCSEDCVVRHELDISRAEVRMLKLATGAHDKVIAGLQAKIQRRDYKIKMLQSKMQGILGVKLKIDRRLERARGVAYKNDAHEEYLKGCISDLQAKLEAANGKHRDALWEIRCLKNSDAWAAAISEEWQRRCDDWRELHPNPGRMPDDERKWLLESLAALDLENTKLSVEVAQLRKEKEEG